MSAELLLSRHYEAEEAAYPSLEELKDLQQQPHSADAVQEEEEEVVGEEDEPGVSDLDSELDLRGLLHSFQSEYANVLTQEHPVLGAPQEEQSSHDSFEELEAHDVQQLERLVEEKLAAADALRSETELLEDMRHQQAHLQQQLESLRTQHDTLRKWKSQRKAQHLRELARIRSEFSHQVLPEKVEGKAEEELVVPAPVVDLQKDPVLGGKMGVSLQPRFHEDAEAELERLAEDQERGVRDLNALLLSPPPLLAALRDGIIPEPRASKVHFELQQMESVPAWERPFWLFQRAAHHEDYHRFRSHLTFELLPADGSVYDHSQRGLRLSKRSAKFLDKFGRRLETLSRQWTLETAYEFKKLSRVFDGFRSSRKLLQGFLESVEVFGHSVGVLGNQIRQECYHTLWESFEKGTADAQSERLAARNIQKSLVTKQRVLAKSRAIASKLLKKLYRAKDNWLDAQAAGRPAQTLYRKMDKIRVKLQALVIRYEREFQDANASREQYRIHLRNMQALEIHRVHDLRTAIARFLVFFRNFVQLRVESLKGLDYRKNPPNLEKDLAEFVVNRIGSIEIANEIQMDLGYEFAYRPEELEGNAYLSMSRIYDITLSDLMESQSIVSGNSVLPRPLTAFTQHLEEEGLKVPGIFLHSALVVLSSPELRSELMDIRRAIEQHKCYRWKVSSPHIVALAFLSWLRSLREPLIPIELYEVCLGALDPVLGEREDWRRGAADGAGPPFVTRVQSEVIPRLPALHRRVLIHLLQFLRTFLRQSRANRTSLEGLAELFAPVILRPDPLAPQNPELGEDEGEEMKGEAPDVGQATLFVQELMVWGSRLFEELQFPDLSPELLHELELALSLDAEQQQQEAAGEEEEKEKQEEGPEMKADDSLRAQVGEVESDRGSDSPVYPQLNGFQGHPGDGSRQAVRVEHAERAYSPAVSVAQESLAHPDSESPWQDPVGQAVQPQQPQQILAQSIEIPPGLELPPGSILTSDMTVRDGITGQILGTVVEESDEDDVDGDGPEEHLEELSLHRVNPPPGIVLPPGTFLGSDRNIYDEELNVVGRVDMVEEDHGSPWREHLDPDSGMMFYFNHETGESRWNPPE